MPTHRSLFKPTRREIEVLQLLCNGYTVKEIAAHLGISRKTAMCHRSSLIGKAEARTTIQLYPWALQRGYLSQQAKSTSEHLPVEIGLKASARESRRDMEGQLLAYAEYARVQYEMFKQKAHAGSGAWNSNTDRARRLIAATNEARLIYTAASKAASDFVSQSYDPA